MIQSIFGKNGNFEPGGANCAIAMFFFRLRLMILANMYMVLLFLFNFLL